jgi:hypothetical protein
VTGSPLPLFARRGRPTPWLSVLLAGLLATCASDDSGGGGPRDVEEDRLRRPADATDSAGDDDAVDEGAEEPPPGDADPSDVGAEVQDEPDGPCIPVCAGRVCGVDPVCGEPCGVPCGSGRLCEDGACVPDPSGDPLVDLSPACAGFCEALCDFLLECGKDDPTCLQRCGASARFQALSTAACQEGARAIVLEQCRLWLDCGGQACAIDHMCLEVLPGISYQCAPLCDHTQTAPACTGGASCQTVSDANGAVMTALGMCFRLF